MCHVSLNMCHVSLNICVRCLLMYVSLNICVTSLDITMRLGIKKMRLGSETMQGTSACVEEREKRLNTSEAMPGRECVN